jgi:pimeloyl-ACP methyl ester carboxylesterase
LRGRRLLPRRPAHARRHRDLGLDKQGAGRSTGDWKRGGFDELALDATAALEALGGVQESFASALSARAEMLGRADCAAQRRAGALPRGAVRTRRFRVAGRSRLLPGHAARAGLLDADIEEAFDSLHQPAGEPRHCELGGAQARVARFADRSWFKALDYEPEPIDAPGRVFEGKTVSYDPAADLDALRIPSLWIYGGADTIIPVDASIAAVRACGATAARDRRVVRGRPYVRARRSCHPTHRARLSGSRGSLDQPARLAC